MQCRLSLEEKVDAQELELQGCEPLEVAQETQLRTSAGTPNILNSSDISSACLHFYIYKILKNSTQKVEFILRKIHGVLGNK